MTDMNYEVAIIGGGPGGLACGQYSSRAGRNTVVIEEMACGGQTMIIDEIENYPGLGKLSGYEIGSKFEEQAINFGCNILYDSVSDLKIEEDGSFIITVSKGTIHAKAVIIATGAKHKNLQIPGEQEYSGHGVSYCATCDGPFFKGKKILVCGGGDSAIQEAIFLTKVSDNVTVCHRRDVFRAQKAVVDKLRDTGKASYKMNTIVLSINGDGNKVTSVTFKDKSTDKEYTEEFDAVFVFVGTTPRTDLVPEVEKNDSGYIITDNHMMTNIKGLFAVGDVRDTPFRQIITAASDGAIAAHYASEYIDGLSK